LKLNYQKLRSQLELDNRLVMCSQPVQRKQARSLAKEVVTTLSSNICDLNSYSI